MPDHHSLNMLSPSRAEQMAKFDAFSMRSQRDGDTHTISLNGEVDLANAGDVEPSCPRAVDSTGVPPC